MKTMKVAPGRSVTFAAGALAGLFFLTGIAFFTLQSDYDQQVAPVGAMAFDCGNESAFRHKGSKDQRVKKFKVE